MPKLKKLTLQGFKSFADPSTFLYPTGITAVVGPNGSGKSNIADAIRWVLGEQRLTSIRGRTGEDMIFAGSPKRSRSGMARAAITFDNADGWLPVDFAEVTVERRTYRDGTSDYILNGNKVRLMDLRDMLDRAGLGRDAYLVIGQGLVDQVLSLRPQERLALFEQAAGITPYRTRREDAVERLEATRGNLQRIYDIVGEIEPRLRRLQRQASKVEEYTRLQEELSGILRVWYGYRWGKALSNLEQARQRAAYQEDKALGLLEGVEELEEKLSQHRKQIGEHRDRLADLHRASSAQHREAAERQRDLAVARERQRQLRERVEESQARLGPLQSALEAEGQDIDTLETELAELGERRTAARERLGEAEEAHKAQAAQRDAIRRQRSEAQTRALELRHRLADRQSRLEQAKERVAELDRQIEERKAAIAAATEKRRAQQTAVETARRELEALQEDLEGVHKAASEVQEQLRTGRQREQEVREGLNSSQAEYQRVMARLEALDRLHAEGAGMYAGVRAVLQATEKGELKGLPGPVSSLMRVPAELERGIEAALGSQLQNVIAETWDAAQTAIGWLKQHQAGRATFLPLDTLRPPSPLVLPEMPGVVGVASELVRYESAYQPAVQLLLGKTAVVDELSTARKLHRELKGGFQIVTLDGEIVRSSGSVTGGDSQQARGPGLLARERERRQLRQRVGDMEEAISQKRDLLHKVETGMASLAGRQSELTGKRQEAELAVRNQERSVERLVGELERAVEEIRWQSSRLDEAQEERAHLSTVSEGISASIAETEVEWGMLTERLKVLEAEWAELADEGVADLLAQRRTQLAVLDQEFESRQVLLESRKREHTRLEQQITDQRQRIAALQQELEGLQVSLKELAAAYDAAQSEAETLASQIPPLEGKLAEMEEELDKLERREQVSQRAVREAEQRLAQAEVDANRREDQLQALRREIEETLDIVISNLPDTISTQQPLPLDKIVCPLPTVVDLPQGLERQIRDLRTQIRRLEPINPAAKEEYEELTERHSYLRSQMMDLERASAHLRQIISELDEMMETMFTTTFKSIASEFTRVFEMLFSGGVARLELGDDEDGRAGVEIMARPPGKRTSSLNMLSGGERSLTAVALIFSVMRVSPTPFCVLDEVDAMLDEANVGRFRRMLRELARETQFVIITHNRGTVEVADTIYGVSMGDDGTSEVLSLSLEDLPTSEAI
ncbi:MAG: chromosome segregation protein SMC [Anaerolineae bacterium]